MPAARKEKKNSKKKESPEPLSVSLCGVSLSVYGEKKKSFSSSKATASNNLIAGGLERRGKKKIKIRKKKNVSRHRSVLSLSQLLKPNPKEENRKEGEKIEDEEKASK